MYGANEGIDCKGYDWIRDRVKDKLEVIESGCEGGEIAECDAGFFSINSEECGTILTRPFSTSGYSEEDGGVNFWTDCPDCEYEDYWIYPLDRLPDEKLDCEFYGYDLLPEMQVDTLSVIHSVADC